MWKTFIAELKHIFSNKWRVAGLFVLLFIPFTYGFLYMNAYWAPFKHVDELKIAVVSKDLDNNGHEERTSHLLTESLTKDGLTAGANQIYKVVDVPLENRDPNELVDSGEYAAVIVIPKGYTAAMNKFEAALKDKFDKGQLRASDVQSEFIKAQQEIAKHSAVNNNINQVSFYYSYKHSYLSGEMTNFISNNAELVIKSLFPNAVSTITSTDNNIGLIASLIHKMLPSIVNTDKFVSIDKYGSERFNTYGLGLAPYFISIAMWAGALSTLFVVKNDRHIKTESTIKHMFGKLAVWWMISGLQALILITAVTLQGVNIGWEDQWRMYAFALFMALIFPSIVMFTAYTMRYGDIGEFIIVILLVLQLISSSGTFPVEMQNIIFKIIHPVAPFTYTISSLREIMWDTDVLVLFKNMAILLAFPVVMAPISIYLNHRFDRKSVTTIKGIKTYSSYEIHLDDY